MKNRTLRFDIIGMIASQSSPWNPRSLRDMKLVKRYRYVMVNFIRVKCHSSYYICTYNIFGVFQRKLYYHLYLSKTCIPELINVYNWNCYEQLKIFHQMDMSDYNWIWSRFCRSNQICFFSRAITWVLNPENMADKGAIH